MPYHILLVEGHPAMRQAVASVLARAEDVDLCAVGSSAEDALDLLRHRSCDLVLASVTLLGRAGTDLITRVHTERPGLPVIVDSATGDPTGAARAHDLGAIAYLETERLAADLVDTIRTVLREPTR